MAASNIVIELRDLLTTKIMTVNGIIIPLVSVDSETQIDVHAMVADQQYLLKIVILSGNQINQKEQLYDAISQIYEYCYLQNLGDIIPVLVCSSALHVELNWMYDYLETERKLKLIWHGDGKLHSSPQTQRELAFLW